MSALPSQCLTFRSDLLCGKSYLLLLPSRRWRCPQERQDTAHRYQATRDSSAQSVYIDHPARRLCRSNPSDRLAGVRSLAVWCLRRVQAASSTSFGVNRLHVGRVFPRSQQPAVRRAGSPDCGPDVLEWPPAQTPGPFSQRRRHQLAIWKAGYSPEGSRAPFLD